VRAGRHGRPARTSRLRPSLTVTLARAVPRRTSMRRAPAGRRRLPPHPRGGTGARSGSVTCHACATRGCGRAWRSRDRASGRMFIQESQEGPFSVCAVRHTHL